MPKEAEMTLSRTISPVSGRRARFSAIALVAGVSLVLSCSFHPTGGHVLRPAPASPEDWRVYGQVLETRDYCGGANPSHEMLEYLRTAHPVAGMKLYIRGGEVNRLENPILQTVTSDAQGKFQTSLPPGDYCFVGEAKKDELKVPDFTKENQQIAASPGSGRPYKLTSEQCLRAWWSTCDKTIQVQQQDLRGVVIPFHRGCNPPCVQGGPLRR